MTVAQNTMQHKTAMNSDKLDNRKMPLIKFDTLDFSNNFFLFGRETDVEDKKLSRKVQKFNLINVILRLFNLALFNVNLSFNFLWQSWFSWTMKTIFFQQKMTKAKKIECCIRAHKTRGQCYKHFMAVIYEINLLIVDHPCFPTIVSFENNTSCSL